MKTLEILFLCIGTAVGGSAAAILFHTRKILQGADTRWPGSKSNV